ncbi:MAG: hypothetical protein JOZ57_18020 [Abitibacteriaceae bacterium]|nr:hypothetical protein [Abditibacteriaceae bacterium]
MQPTVSGGWVKALCSGLEVSEETFKEGRDAVCPPATSGEPFCYGCILELEEMPEPEAFRQAIRSYFEPKGYTYEPGGHDEASGILGRPNGSFLTLTVTFSPEARELIVTVR